jgi:hypothetical protein
MEQTRREHVPNPDSSALHRQSVRLMIELKSITAAYQETLTLFAGGLVQVAMEETVLHHLVVNKPVRQE